MTDELLMTLTYLLLNWLSFILVELHFDFGLEFDSSHLWLFPRGSDYFDNLR